MLNVAMVDEDGLYWEADAMEVILAKKKKINVDKESVTDSVSTMKMAISSVKTRQTNSNHQKLTEAMPPAKNTTTQDAQTVVSQVSTITQLTKQVSILQLAHNEINLKLDKLAKFIMAQLATNKTASPSKHEAAGGLRGSPATIHEYQVQPAMCMVHSRPAKRTISKQTLTRPLPGLDEPDTNPRSQADRWGHKLGKNNQIPFA